MEEHRKFQRFSVDLQAHFSISGSNDRSEECRIIELSKEGLRLLFKERIRFGQNLALSLELPTHKTPIHADIVLRWSKQLYDEIKFEYMAGAEFTQIAQEDQQAILHYAQSCS